MKKGDKNRGNVENPNSIILSAEFLENKIYLIRGAKVMLDKDLAALYGVHTKRLNEQVKRNRLRFPEDFMFRLSVIETDIMIRASRSQFATLKKGKNIKYRPYAFTEQGIAMLSSVLNSKRAILVNIAIMRVFVKLRHMISKNKELEHKLQELERKVEMHDSDIIAIFNAIRQIIKEDNQPKKKFGFETGM